MSIYDLKIDETGDICLDGADLATITDSSYQLIQRLKVKLQMLWQEWFLNSSMGIPVTQYIVDNANNMPAITAIYRTAIKNTDGVTTLDTLTVDLDRDARQLTVIFSVNKGSPIAIEVAL